MGYKHYMLENINISVNMGTGALVAGQRNSRNTCIHIKISSCQLWTKLIRTTLPIHLFFSLILNTNKDYNRKLPKSKKHL